MPRKIVGYKLVPHYEPDEEGDFLTTAAVASCAVTGETLTGMGGGGVFVSPKVYRLLTEGKIKLPAED